MTQYCPPLLTASLRSSTVCTGCSLFSIGKLVRHGPSWSRILTGTSHLSLSTSVTSLLTLSTTTTSFVSRVCPGFSHGSSWNHPSLYSLTHWLDTWNGSKLTCGVPSSSSSSIITTAVTNLSPYLDWYLAICRISNALMV